MRKSINYISAILGIAGFIMPYLFKYFKDYQSGIQITSFILLAIATVMIVISDLKNRPKRFKTDPEINEYMLNWISTTGRITIFTRDMTWGKDYAIKEKLIQKAESNELIICMPRKNNIAEELKSHGARIVEFNRTINYTTEARFTIIKFGTSDAKVAIGKRYGNYHVIEEYADGEHPLFHVTQDLVNLLIKADDEGRTL